jgi:hypothetical protein
LRILIASACGAQKLHRSNNRHIRYPD